MEAASPGWRPQRHLSLSVTANRRLTFRIDTTEGEIYDVNLEDYH